MAGETTNRVEEAPLLEINGDVSNLLLPFRGGDDNGAFSFRRQTEQPGSINICPSSLRDAIRGQLHKDISMQQMKYGYDSEENMFQNILNNIPAVQIREYAHDARVVQIQNCVKAFKMGWDAFQESSNKDSLWEKFKSFITLLPKEIQNTMGKLSSWPNAVNPSRISKMDDKFKAFVLHIPFLLYYQMMTSKNTGYYTLPYSGKLVDYSNGQNGWNGWNPNHGFTGGETSTNSILGTVLNFLGKNINFNTTPTWDGNTTTDFPNMEVQFDLFNDSVQSAVNNFLFLHSIAPKNRFIQYHIFQHNPCVYDVKVEGYGRFYMCSGSVQCDYKGVSRRPSDKFFKTLYNKMGTGWKISETDASYLIKDKIIRIPDVYSFRINLQSLLPNSLNNYLFQFSGNMDMENWQLDAVPESKSTEVQTAYNTAFDNAGTTSGFIEEAKKAKSEVESKT